MEFGGVRNAASLRLAYVEFSRPSCGLREPKRAFFEGSCLQTPPKFQEKMPRERKPKKNRVKCWAVQLPGKSGIWAK